MRENDFLCENIISFFKLTNYSYFLFQIHFIYFFILYKKLNNLNIYKFSFMFLIIKLNIKILFSFSIFLTLIETKLNFSVFFKNTNGFQTCGFQGGGG